MEFRIVKFFNKLGLGVLDNATDFISRIKYLVYFWAAAALIFLSFDKVNGQTIFLGITIAIILHFIITEGLIKHLLTKIFGKRQRPYLINSEIQPIGRQFTDSSFPSSHMATTLAVLTVIVYFENIWLIPAIILSVFMAYARMHQGMHYLSDIIIGAILGILYGWGGIYIVNNFL